MINGQARCSRSEAFTVESSGIDLERGDHRELLDCGVQDAIDDCRQRGIPERPMRVQPQRSEGPLECFE